MIPFHPIVSRKKLRRNGQIGDRFPASPGRALRRPSLRGGPEIEWRIGKRGMPEEDFRAPFQACRGAITTGAGDEKAVSFLILESCVVSGSMDAADSVGN